MAAKAAAEVSTAVVVWNAETEKQIVDLINAGKSVPQALVKASPKNFVSKLRQERRVALGKQTGFVLGHLAKSGFDLMSINATIDAAGNVQGGTTLRNGDQKIKLEVVKRQPTEADKLKVENESLKAELEAIKKKLGIACSSLLVPVA